MPTYRYQCNACGHELELFQSMSDRTKRKCPSCLKPKLQRLIGAGAGVIFKGSGFYETDYRSASYKAGEKAGESNAKDGGGSDSSGSGPADSGTKKDAPAAGSSSPNPKADKKKQG